MGGRLHPEREPMAASPAELAKDTFAPGRLLTGCLCVALGLIDYTGGVREERAACVLLKI